jgi:predicted permease
MHLLLSIQNFIEFHYFPHAIHQKCARMLKVHTLPTYDFLLKNRGNIPTGTVRRKDLDKQMAENFIVVGIQVIILFILIGIGFLSGKTKIIRQEAIHSLNNFILYIVSPLVIVKAFYRDYDPVLFIMLLEAGGLAILTHLLNILLAHLLLKDKDRRRQCVLHFGAVFSNCGFMAIPLQSALLSDDGVFFGAAYIAVFNIFCWTYGLVLMSGSTKELSVGKILCNPGVLGVGAGLFLFLTGITLPVIIYEPISYMAALNTPIPMVIIGFMLWEIIHNGMPRVRRILTYRKMYVTLGLRLVLVPLLILGILHMLPVNKTLAMSVMICASAPVAATTTMFSEKFDADTDISVTLVSLSTVCSLVTMPLTVGLARYLLI